MTTLTDRLRRLAQKHATAARPCVTVSYAQSLDGCITAAPGEPTALSGAASMAFTHRLRAVHAAILVGVGTVLTDDPQLTVRLVHGRNPQPIVLDTHLRTPAGIRLLQHPTHTLWIATAEEEAPAHLSHAMLLTLPATAEGVSLAALLERLQSEGIRSVMVEGGAAVITAFLRAGLADDVIVTVAPQLIGAGGLHAPGALPYPVELHNVSHHSLGDDLILWGEGGQKPA